MPNKYFIKRTGFLNASGKDFMDFINRMSTNDFKKFPENEFRKTVLTTDKGRVIDLINVLNIPGSPSVITSNDFQDKVISHLDKYIITDDVKFEQSPFRYFQILIIGDNLIEISKNHFNIQIEKNKIYKLNESDFIFYDDFKLETLNIVCREENLNNYKALLTDMSEMSCTEYEFKRIEAGIPEGVNEFNERINPVECNLEKYVSFTKGCYIGQEVIARLDSQGKKPKQMVKINSYNAINRDDKIFSEDKDVGFISSVINYNGKYSGLGFIRSVNLDFENKYFSETNGEKFEINIYHV